MTFEPEGHAEDLFQRAAELPPEERESFLEKQCGADSRLRAAVESLLEHFERAQARFASPVRGAPGSDDPQAIGPYRILEKIGEGGFGLVYSAEQTEPVRRRVALKVLKAGMDTRAVLARFEAERQALALMDHPGIARVLDAGETSAGRPYFVMELVKGEPVTDYCDRHRLPLQARIELFLQVCHAVQHAHQKGIIHRDLKPSNILVAVTDGRPNPKVIDFGIAKATTTRLTDKTLHTAHGQLMGTPVYMSPEQAEHSTLDVDTTTDVYSLGVILFELLTGEPPLAQADLLQDGLQGVAERIRALEPRPPSARWLDEDADRRAALRGLVPSVLARELRGDLDWIALRAIDKDRTRRYQAANLLALDLQRYLDDEPVEAGPPSTRYRLRKFARRHRAALGVAAAVVFGVLGVAGGLSVALLQANRQRTAIENALREAQRARQDSEAVTDFLANVLAAAGPEALGREVTVRQALDAAARSVEREFRERPEIEAQLRTTIGAAYRELGDFETAAQHLRWACDTRARLLGPESEPALASLRELAELARQRGDYASAESLFTWITDRRTRR